MILIQLLNSIIVTLKNAPSKKLQILINTQIHVIKKIMLMGIIIGCFGRNIIGQANGMGVIKWMIQLNKKTMKEHAVPVYVHYHALKLPKMMVLTLEMLIHLLHMIYIWKEIELAHLNHVHLM